MKYLLLTMAMLATALGSQAQVKYQVSGKCPAGVKKVYVTDLTGRSQVIDSVTVKNGQFLLQGETEKDALLGVSADNESVIHVFFNDGQPITADLGKATLRGSELNSRLNDYDRKLDSINNVSRTLSAQYQHIMGDSEEIDETKQAELVPLMKQMQSLSIDELGTYAAIMRETDTLIPMVYLEELVKVCDIIGNNDKLEELLSTERPYYNHPMGRRTIERIRLEQQKQKLIGQPFIDLEEADMSGTMHRLSDYCGRGNYVFIDFWASWCGPCMAEMPNVKANYEKYHAKGFQIVGLSFDQKAEAWKKAVRDKGLNWIHLSDLKGWQTIAAETYNINSIPSSLLVDPEGIVIARDLRGAKLGEKLKEIYGF